MNILNIDTPEGLAEFEAHMTLNEELHTYVLEFNKLMEEAFYNYKVTLSTASFLRERIAADYEEEIKPYTLITGINPDTGAMYALVVAK